ncbi:MAG: hypothetical protein MJ165_04640 [Alphaproteobacteria bacterium]|nr:hypothetical protein [Alphaproteobacteria bacterium]
MFGKIKKVFFTGMFGILYISYIAQLVYVLTYLQGCKEQVIGLALLSVEWLVLIAARYLSKKSSNNAQQYNNGFRRR